MAAKSRLGRGLGALFPALPDEQDLVAPKKSPVAEEESSDKKNDSSARPKTAAKPTVKKATAPAKKQPAAKKAARKTGTKADSLTAGSAGRVDSRPASPTASAEGAPATESKRERQGEVGVATDAQQEGPVSPLESTIPSMGTMTRNASTVSMLSRPMTLQPEAAVHKLDVAADETATTEIEAVKKADESSSTGRKGRKRMSMPAIGDMAHPSDMFFDGTPVVDPEKFKAAAAGYNVDVTASQAPAATDAEGQPAELKPVAGGYLMELRLDEIGPNLHQPRMVFNENELRELAESIAEVGVLQPIVVRHRPAEQIEAAKASKAARAGQSADGAAADESFGNIDGSATIDELNALFEGQMDSEYELIMGERRWRASKLAGFETIPAIVKTTADDSMLRDALLENLHRVALNPLEEAAAYQQMIDEFGMTQLQLSKSVSKSRPQIANTLRLMNLPASVQKRVVSGQLTAGHARALLGLPNEEMMEQVAQRIVDEGLSVRSVEEIVAMSASEEDQARHKPRQRNNPWSGSPIPERLGERFGTKVSIKGSEKHGRIEIVFSSPEELDRISALLMTEE
ncbi:ParB/RepB/Spo0J family partition protein [Bifidobacterium choloepi]|uniref:ParB/RepB/Spo0J family partition protein n=1 Tax=Bifidobacterium choloepi TaxID=2614131 RepID=A0A6I5N1F5_9BIFI|nr:ParB/RepB/Spo0J family partition protein [Bifidobacterium choloepi]NEG69975.1 ParB/RepB/Spo0J family partition protein [Bifidobacterium choloepi]